MPWYMKVGAHYMTNDGRFTWDRRRARIFPSKPPKDEQGVFFASFEEPSPSTRRTPCVAAKREEELMAKAL